jgi:hypothetical protein
VQLTSSSSRFRALAALAGVAVLVLIAGCGAMSRDDFVASTTEGSTTEGLTFQYVPSGGQNTINQRLVIINGGPTARAPVLRFSALGSSGDVLPDVTVSTVYGSDVGHVLVPRGAAEDVLVFAGPGAGEVADVLVTVLSSAVVDLPAAWETPVEVEPLGADGRQVTRNDLFTSVRLRNDNAAPVNVRLVYIVWDVPSGDRTQQAAKVVPVGDRITVEGEDTVTVPMTGEAAAANKATAGTAAASIKAYLTP